MWKFAHSPLDRQSHLRHVSGSLKQWKNQQNSQLILLNEKYQILMQPDGIHPANSFYHDERPGSQSWIYLGHTEDQPWFCARVKSGEFELRFHQQWQDLRLALSMIAEPFASIVAYAKAMIYWHRYHAFCGKCGGQTFVHKSGHERVCEKCSNAIFPRTDPAIIVSVTHEDQILLARQSSWPEKRYSVLAGFVEPGESFEQAVKREVWEESQLPLKKVDYVGSQPWPFPCSIMIGFTAEAEHTQYELLDQELEHAMWVNPKSIVSLLERGELRLSTPESISYHLISRWATKHKVNLTRFLP